MVVWITFDTLYLYPVHLISWWDLSSVLECYSTSFASKYSTLSSVCSKLLVDHGFSVFVLKGFYLPIIVEALPQNSILMW